MRALPAGAGRRLLVGSSIGAGVAGVANAQPPPDATSAPASAGPAADSGSSGGGGGGASAGGAPPGQRERVTVAAYFLITTSPDEMVQVAHTVAARATATKFDKELKSAGAPGESCPGVSDESSPQVPLTTHGRAEDLAGGAMGPS